MAVVLPVFSICSVDERRPHALTRTTAAHLRHTQLEHRQSLAQQAQPRARRGAAAHRGRPHLALVEETLTAVEHGRPDAEFLVLEVTAAAAEAAADAADLALRAGGGAAFRKESPVERLFRDSRAARVMAPTTDALHDFIGRALCGLPLLGDVT
jgi:alkylation response protein AidB-like acyl-CoA dehydrogenase